MKVRVQSAQSLRSVLEDRGVPPRDMEGAVARVAQLNPDAIRPDGRVRAGQVLVVPDSLRLEDGRTVRLHDVTGAAADVTPVEARAPGGGQPMGALGLHALRVPLPKNFAWYGPPDVAPAFLTASGTRAGECFFDFAVGGGNDGNAGSGVHLGGGFVLTAFHVVRHALRQGEHPEGAAFVGDGLAFWNGRWQVKALPERGSYNLNHWNEIEPTAASDGGFNDFALVHAGGSKNHGAVAGIRATGDVKANERLFIIGDSTAGVIRVATGAFASDQSKAFAGAAILEDCDLEAGFSGSPVVDRDGLLVGVMFATDDHISHMVRTESIMPLLAAAREVHDVPHVPTTGF